MWILRFVSSPYVLGFSFIFLDLLSLKRRGDGSKGPGGGREWERGVLSSFFYVSVVLFLFIPPAWFAASVFCSLHFKGCVKKERSGKYNFLYMRRYLSHLSKHSVIRGVVRKYTIFSHFVVLLHPSSVYHLIIRFISKSSSSFFIGPVYSSKSFHLFGFEVFSFLVLHPRWWENNPNYSIQKITITKIKFFLPMLGRCPTPHNKNGKIRAWQGNQTKKK